MATFKAGPDSTIIKQWINPWNLSIFISCIPPLEESYLGHALDHITQPPIREHPQILENMIFCLPEKEKLAKYQETVFALSDLFCPEPIWVIYYNEGCVLEYMKKNLHNLPLGKGQGYPQIRLYIQKI